jgi:hypothetical protein
VPEYQRETIEAKRARRWGGIVALGGLAFAAAAYIGLLSTSNNEYSACDIPNPAKACQTVHQEESDWWGVVAYSGVIAAAGSVAFFGANALDKRLLVYEHARRIETESKSAGTTDVAIYMQRMPEAPPEGDYGKDI